MDFNAWVVEQKPFIHALRVAPGRYWARYSPSTRSYSAGVLSTSATTLPTVDVTATPTVRARVTHVGSEYDYQPARVGKGGFEVARLSPQACTRETAETTTGLARAALLCAARYEYDRLRNLAIDTDEGRWEDVLVALTVPPHEGTRADAQLRAAVVAQLAVQGGGVEMACAPWDCACLGCGATFKKDAEVFVRAFVSTVVCCACLSTALPARAA